MSKPTANNTSVEQFDDQIANEPMTQDEILMKEGDILAGLLNLDREKDDTGSFRKVQIKRKGVLMLEFRVRPISEEESQQCFRNATKYAKSKPGQPRIPIETDSAKNRSYIIYTATVDEDRQKVWDNPKALQAMNLLQGVDMIDRVLLAGEKAAIIAIIDEISGYTDETEELAKNS